MHPGRVPTKEVVAIAKRANQTNVNQRIRAKTVRLIQADGEQAGIVPIEEALEVAKKAALDLVEVAPNADPPVCRIMDYGKFKYQASKKGQETKKKGRAVQLKEVRMRPRTEDHDLGFKLKNIRKFLEKRDRVKVTVLFRGREMAYMDQGMELLKRVAEEVEEIGSVEQSPTREGWRLTMVLVPK
jgi:translation initiation factor IF-3